MAGRSGWWLTSSAHVVADHVPAPPDAVRDFYCDLRNITAPRPLAGVTVREAVTAHAAMLVGIRRYFA